MVPVISVLKLMVRPPIKGIENLKGAFNTILISFPSKIGIDSAAMHDTPSMKIFGGVARVIQFTTRCVICEHERVLFAEYALLARHRSEMGKDMRQCR
jgi:hypothetical protein